MIKSFSAATREVDDARLAVDEILAGLNLEANLLKNSLGIISCFSEFDESGVCMAICKALPFDCIGSTTCLCASGREIDQILFVITVLTSDDCSFGTAAIPINAEYKNALGSAISGLRGQSAGNPALLLGCFPLMNKVSGDMILESVDQASGGIPLFGTIAIDHNLDYKTAKTIHNGEMFRESAVLGAVYGNPDFSFDIATFEENKVRSQKAIITASDGNLLIGVNGKTTLEYFDELGITRDELSIGMGIIPLVVDHKDGGKPIARAVFGLTPEGYAVCGGVMPVNQAVTIARIDKSDVLQTTERAVRQLTAKEGVILSFSCIARFVTLGMESKAEAEKVMEVVGNARYHYACSGGEICPLPDTDGRLKNFFHNYTNVFCRLG